MTAQAAHVEVLRNQSPEQWLKRALRVAPLVASGLLVIALAWQLVQLPRTFMGAVSNATVEGAEPNLVRTAAPAGFDLNSIVNAHLFGIASSESHPSDVSALPQTQMNLVLTGTMASADPQKGYAIVGESAATAKTYQTGATLRPGTKLHLVYTDRVILDSSGRLETLVLPRESSGGAAIGDDLRRIAETNPGTFLSAVSPQPAFSDAAQLPMPEPVEAIHTEVAESSGGVLKEAEFVQSPESLAAVPTDIPTVFELPSAMPPEIE